MLSPVNGGTQTPQYPASTYKLCISVFYEPSSTCIVPSTLQGCPTLLADSTCRTCYAMASWWRTICWYKNSFRFFTLHHSDSVLDAECIWLLASQVDVFGGRWYSFLLYSISRAFIFPLLQICLISTRDPFFRISEGKDLSSIIEKYFCPFSGFDSIYIIYDIKSKFDILELSL